MNEFELTIENQKLKNQLMVQQNRALEGSYKLAEQQNLIRKGIALFESAFLEKSFNLDEYHDYCELCEAVDYRPGDNIVNYFVDLENTLR